MASVSSRSWSEELYRFGFFVVVIIFSVFLQQGQLDSVVRDSILRLQAPAWELTGVAQENANRLNSGFQLLRLGGGRLAVLEAEVTGEKIDQTRLAELERENQLLRQELGRVQGSEIQIYRFYGNGSEWFIDGGSQQGVQVGQHVQREGALIGVVEETYGHFSRVKTLFDKEWRVPVQIGSDSARPRGVYDSSKGVGLVRYVPVAFPIEVNQPVRTLGDADLPPQLLLGWVEEVQPAEDQATWQITVQTAFPPSTLEWVEIHARGEGP